VDKFDIIRFFICLLGSFAGVYVITPLIVLVAKRKKLVDAPNERSSHHKSIPRLGGVAFFFSIGIGIYFLQNIDYLQTSVALLTSLIILLLIGLKDDISNVKPSTKLIAHLLCAATIFFQQGFELNILSEIVHNLGWIHSANFSWLVFLIIPVFVNAYNLIDGIDGLATITGIIIFTVFGALFYLIGDYYFMGICLLGIGSLLAFLRFNLTDSHFKLFMGDTGSMIIGFIISVMIIRILSVNSFTMESKLMTIYYAPIFILSVIFIPFYDMCRVIVVRLLRKQHIFVADKSHMHHILINHYQWKHKKTTFILGLINIFIIGLLFSIHKFFGIAVTIAVFSFIISFMSWFLFKMEKTNKSKVAGSHF
jgi:UDP-N-acetylmuramyl pentapeptide phosphotransferase/UDP-N-acetylglucosamine-1-phosphate transferase